MKNITTALLLLAGACANAQTQADYETAVRRFQIFYNQKQGDSIYAQCSDKIKSMMTPDQLKAAIGHMYTQFGAMQSYELSNQKDGFMFYKSVFANSTQSLVISLNKDNKMETFRFVPYKTEAAKNDKSNITLKTPTGEISGTLSMPDQTGKVPVVLIIAGSGPTDRDGNNPLGVKANTYKMIADSLKQAGIASVRYDKRGVAESATALKDASDLRFDDMVNDAAGFVKMLKADARFSKVIVLGHSEGSLVGMMAAKKEQAAAFISVSGIAQRADKVMEKQVTAQSAELGKEATTILDSLTKGYTVKNVSDVLATLFSPSVQPYMISWLKYTPSDEIKKLNTPVLIVQGTTDIQVGVDEAELLKKAKPTATLTIVKGMNHVLKESPEDRMANAQTYGNPDLPLCTGLMPAVIKFVKGTKN